MYMETKASKQVKQLGELLQQQQEPFILEVYLSEKGCLKRPCSGNGLSCSPGSSNSANYLPKLLKAFCKKIVKQTFRKDGQTSAEKVRDNQEVAEPDRFSLASSMTIYNSCTEDDAEDKPVSSGIQHQQPHMTLDNAGEVNSGKKDNNVVEKDNGCYCHNPIGVSTEPSSVRRPFETAVQDEATRRERNVPTCRIARPKKISEDTILSASILEILFKSTKDKPNFDKVVEPGGLIKFHIRHEYLSSKSLLQQTKQLLFDCVREVIENHGRKEKVKRGEKLLLGAEEIGKLICQKIMAWGETSGNEDSIGKLLHSDFVGTVEEWEDCVPQKMQIGMEVGDAILEDMRNETITEMIGFLKA